MTKDIASFDLPSAEEILAGTTQAGVAPPPGFTAHEDDGSVQRVAGGDLLPATPSTASSDVAELERHLRAAHTAYLTAKHLYARAKQELEEAEQAWASATLKAEHGL